MVTPSRILVLQGTQDDANFRSNVVIPDMFGGKPVRLMLASCLYTCSASVGIRRIQFRLLDAAGNVLSSSLPSSNASAGQIIQASWGMSGGAIAASLGGEPQSLGGQSDIWVLGGWTVRAFGIAGLAGDNVRNFFVTLAQ